MTQSTTQSTIVNFWQKLTRPHPSITDLEQRRQSRLLAILSALLFFSITFIIIWRLIDPSATVENGPRQLLFLVIGDFVLAVLYLLNRTGKYRQSAYLLT